MRYMLSESAAKALAKLLKDSKAVVAADAAPTRLGRADACTVSDVHPFKMVGENGEEKSFKIFLPFGCVSYQDSALTPSGVTSVTGDWYSVDALGDVGTTKSDASSVYCIIAKPTTGGVYCKITGAPDSVTDEIIVKAEVARIYTAEKQTDGDSDDAEEAEYYNIVAVQLLRSSLAVGKSEGGGSSTSGFTGYKRLVTRLVWDYDETGDHALHEKSVNLHFVDGVLKNEEYAETDRIVFDTTKHSEE